MKKLSYLLLFVVLLNFPNETYSQKNKSRGFAVIVDRGKEIADLSETVAKECSQTIRREIADNFVEVKFQPQFAAEAETLVEELKTSTTETRRMLFPLKVQSVRFYLLQMDNAPVNYSINEKRQAERTYIHLEIFKNPAELIVNNQSVKSYRASIFTTIPHELTHTALESVIKYGDTRWFDDGLADYVGNGVAEKFSDKDFQERTLGYLPSISLHRADIRENIWLWREPTQSSIKQNMKQLLSEFYYYGASYQLIKEIVAEAEKKGIENPLSLLLTRLKESKEKNNKPAGTPEIISLIEQHLKVNPKTLGVLDEQMQKNLVGEALETLSENKVSPEKKYPALYTLAGIGEINLSDKWLNYLLDEVYISTDEEFQKNLAATALAQRFGQSGFDSVLTIYSGKNKNMKAKSVKKIKQELQELSIRPKPQ